ncbi:LysE family translocator [Dickeya dianthicola]|uniref:LysE family translocator n=1 Tax=Dickeya dianthicola TaxID=204039 RepID=UPI00136D803E|nr:LysE family translocator [Dickeya dianthicola]MCI4186974.1 LysE family translocator [Dickeya dianthicola]MZI88896.1 LysE family translocator [Dickeya dianthicola]QOL15222.1 LysE family translocator [Dickeya dianthicola]
MLDVNWLLFFAASLTINAIPGADVVYVTGNYHRSGWPAASLSALGLALGYYFYVFITWLGVTAVIFSFPVFYTLIQLAGAVYLLWMGYGIYHSKPSDISGRNESEITSKTRSFLINGVVISILNPKVGVFFVSFFPQFISHSSPSYLILILGTAFCLGATFFNIFYCFLTAQLKRLASGRVDFLLGTVPGIILMLLGIWMIYAAASSYMSEL